MKSIKSPFLDLLIVCSFSVGIVLPVNADSGVDFFEKKIRPVLVQKCYSCHSKDSKRVRGGLLVDTKKGLMEGGDSGPSLVPGDPKKSLLIKAILQEDDLRMPPKEKLSDRVIADFQKWVKMGAPDPRDTSNPLTPRKKFAITEADRNHWAYQTVANVQPPKIENQDWAQFGIDHFVLARLAEKGLEPSPIADRYTLLRRAKYDLTGLPPTPKEIQKFLDDDSPKAFEKAIDTFLNSKEFGERWARHWLDGVRYATDVDKSGHYRSWVINAFNKDLPYDDFIRYQLAGDLIPAKESDPAKVHVSGASLEHIKGTGMLALAVWEKVARNLAVAEIVDSQIDVIGRQLLGTTMACARCHDHKYDPISTKDYYAMAGILFSSHISPGKLYSDARLTADVTQIPLLSKKDAEKNRRIDEKISPLQKKLTSLEKKFGPAVKLMGMRSQIKQAQGKLKKAKGNSRKKLEKGLKKLQSEEKKLLADQKKKGWDENPPELMEIKQLRKQIAGLRKTKVDPPSCIGAQEGGVKGSNREKIGDCPVYIRGDFRKPGGLVPRRFPVILAGEDQVPISEKTKGSGRLELANWIASEDNPLTGRVMVNRVWLYLIGEGLVRSPDNFGTLGDTPSHPELLDYLTRRFMDSGWSVKRLIKEIMLSSTYQQSSFGSEEVIKLDPENRLLARMNRKRLDYEAFRDTLLFVSGQLQKKGRTIYRPILRLRVDQTRMMFDGPDPLNIIPERPTTTTTPQALYLMNNKYVAIASGLVRDILERDRSLKTPEAKIEQAYLRLLGRRPSSEETQIGKEYLQRGSLENYINILFCTNEFVYLD